MPMVYIRVIAVLDTYIPGIDFGSTIALMAYRAGPVKEVPLTTHSTMRDSPSGD